MRLAVSALLISLSLALPSSSQAPASRLPAARQPVLGHRSASLLTVDGLQFKDLNRNGRLDRYEGHQERLCRAVPERHAGWAENGSAVHRHAVGRDRLSRTDRFAKVINAGVDQVGGTDDVASLLDAAKTGKLSHNRMREAAERVLEQKFAIGIFEDPYVDAAAAKQVVGIPLR